jgi:hypothetical protein
MHKLIPTALFLSLAAGTAAIAQTTSPTAPPAPRDPAMNAPTTTTPATPSVTPPSTMGDIKTLSEDQAKAWIDKPVYSMDGKNVGEVATLVRDSSGKVTGLHADIGGFLGMGETRVRVMPDKFMHGTDRVNLSLSQEELKAMPKVAK